jgi:hypothetical protein
VAGVGGSFDGGLSGDIGGGIDDRFPGSRNNEERQFSGESSMSGPTNLNSPKNNPHQIVKSSHNIPFNNFIPNKGFVSPPLSHNQSTQLILPYNQIPQQSIDFRTDIQNQPVKLILSPIQPFTQPTYTSPITINSPIVTPIMSNQDLFPHLPTVTISKEQTFPFSFQADGTHTKTLIPHQDMALISVPHHHITKNQPPNRTKAKPNQTPSQKIRTGPLLTKPNPV